MSSLHSTTQMPSFPPRETVITGHLVPQPQALPLYTAQGCFLGAQLALSHFQGLHPAISSLVATLLSKGPS